MKGSSKWMVPIMGFRESTISETGIEKLWKRLRPMTGADTFLVTPYEWNENLRGLARFILRNSRTDEAEVMVIAYSWGCGVGFLKFAREAEALGIPIKIAALCDPVYRSRIFPSWLPFNPISISPVCRPVIRVPVSVQRVEWVRQNLTIPNGHDLVAEDPDRTRIGRGKYVDEGHTRIDESLEFTTLVESCAQEFVFDL